MMLKSTIGQRPLRGLVLTGALVALAALGGCSHEGADWQAATRANTMDAYQHFVSQYPKSPHGADAQARIAQLQEAQDWQAASGTNTHESYEQYLAKHPEGPNAQEARIRLENFAQAAASAGAGAAGAAESGAAGAPAPAPAPAEPGETHKSAAHATSAQGKRATAHHAAPAAHGKSAAAHGKSGHAYVQLGAFHTRARAEQHWKDLVRRFGHEFGALKPRYVKGKSHTAEVVRLQVPVASRADGNALCRKLRAHAQACVPAG